MSQVPKLSHESLSSPDFAVTLTTSTLTSLTIPSKEEYETLSKLMTLRWVALATLFVTVWVLNWLIAESLPLLELNVCLFVMGVSNWYIKSIAAQTSERYIHRLIGSSLLIDIIMLTLLLGYSGGPANPFSVLYLILVMLAAIMTQARWTWAAIITSSICYALIFWFYTPLPSDLGGQHAPLHHSGYQATFFSLHLQGMWLAYTVAALAIGIFVSRLSVMLQRERERRLEGERLLGLAALAAGAAHEIGNPLGTIRVVTSDLETQLKSEGARPEILQDISLINEEVARAKRVLNRLASSAGELRGEMILPIEADSFFKQLIQREEITQGLSLEISPKLPPLTWPVESISQALIQLVRNAHQASKPGALVSVCATLHQGQALIEISDQGCGMSAQTLALYGTPFFTTREGVGLGLGVFVARSLVERLSGEITVESKPGVGTTVRVTLPLKMA